MESFLGRADANTIKALIIFSAVFTLSLLTLLLARKFALRYFYNWARKTDTRADDLILDSLKHPSIYWVIAISLYVALDTSSFAAKYVNYGLSILYILIILSMTLAAANISSLLAQNFIQKKSASVPVTGLSRAVIRGVIFSLGFLIILNSLGISITPILTALGVGGLAVALALQDTLSNVFAGVHILIEQPVRVGDYVRLNTGEEGYINDIGWRTTRIRQLSNNIVIIPNNKLAQSTITNFHMPDLKTALSIKVSVSYSSDVDKVEAILCDEAAKAVGTKGILTEPLPTVRFFPGFGESSLEFTVTCHLAQYTDQFEAQHELRKRIFKRLKDEGVEIPFPTRTVEVKHVT
ncbi:MAG: mechanosensitive ion channel family protein [Deltaproteobacteria bacterium]|nr:mechanosensitive ion channel family protein [Deltaproteobacteria bacterium]